MNEQDWHDAIDRMFQNVDEEQLEEMRQRWLDKGYLKEIKTKFGTLTVWNHKNIPDL